MSALFFGLSTLDIQYLIPSHPLPNSKAKTETANMEIGGPATNAAITFAHLDGSADLATVIGNNPLSTYFKQQFQSFHLSHTDLAPAHPELPTIASVFTSKDNGDRSIITNKPPQPEIDTDLVEQLLRPEIKLILVDGFYMGAAIKLAQLAKEKGIPVVLDGGSWKSGMDQLFPFIDIAICSSDYQLPYGYPLLKDYMKNNDIFHFAITNGENPIAYSSKGTSGTIAVKAVKVVDTLGAGDVFHGAFCYYYLQNHNFTESLEQASIIAGKSCEYLGAKQWMNSVE